MNIFVTSSNPKECAQYLDDKRVVKMVLESTQLLCSAINIKADEQITPYKTTHKNHPCTIWARSSLSNWMWLYNHALALSEEYTNRYNKIHKCNSIIVNLKPLASQYINDIGLEPFVNCTDFKHVDDIYLAYKMCLKEKWKHDKRPPKWHKQERPFNSN